MRHLINIVALMESFEPSDYGYWIEPDGTIISCGTITHGEAAANQLGEKFETEDDEAERDFVDRGVEEGAVRIVASKGSDEFSAEWSQFTVTGAAKAALLQLIRLYQNRDAFVLQSEYFNEYRKAIQYVRSH